MHHDVLTTAILRGALTRRSFIGYFTILFSLIRRAFVGPGGLVARAAVPVEPAVLSQKRPCYGRSFLGLVGPVLGASALPGRASMVPGGAKPVLCTP
jgi:hypothetical protein